MAAPPPPSPLASRPAGTYSVELGDAAPAGGYDQVETEVACFGRAQISVETTTYRLSTLALELSAQQEQERADYDELKGEGAWRQDCATLHRGDGPARTTVWPDLLTANTDEYHYRGEHVASGPIAGANLKSLLTAGVDPARASGWLRYPMPVVRALIAHVDEPDDITPAWEAGVREPKTIIEVATGRLPLSWAVAGAKPIA